MSKWIQRFVTCLAIVGVTFVGLGCSQDGGSSGGGASSSGAPAGSGAMGDDYEPPADDGGEAEGDDAAPADGDWALH